MMVTLLVLVLIVLLLLLSSELLWRNKNIDTEYTRKFIHITVGSFVAFWPLFVPRLTILVLSLAFVAGIFISSMLQVFKAIHSVQRPTYGEIFFALSVGALALVAHSGWIYLAALLHMSLADGLAAVVGTKFGKSNSYKVFGHTKSIAGTLTFVLVSCLILTVYSLATHTPFTPWFIAVTAGATLIENGGILGLDNLLVPVAVALSLNVLH